MVKCNRVLHAHHIQLNSKRKEKTTNVRVLILSVHKKDPNFFCTRIQAYLHTHTVYFIERSLFIRSSFELQPAACCAESQIKTRFRKNRESNVGKYTQKKSRPGRFLASCAHTHTLILIRRMK